MMSDFQREGRIWFILEGGQGESRQYERGESMKAYTFDARPKKTLLSPSDW
jgi:hypothetical protein